MTEFNEEVGRAIGEESRRVLRARTSLAAQLALVDRRGAYDREFWELAIAQGWPGIAIPQRFGGLGLGMAELGIVATSCGDSLSGAPFLIGGYGAVVALLAGDAGLRERWLPELAAGRARAAIALAEGQAPMPRRPEIVFENGTLRGVKQGVAGGSAADFAIVWATHGNLPALVLASLDQVGRPAIPSFDNGRLYADLVFADSPATLLVAGEPAAAVARDMLSRMAVVTACEQLGGAERLLTVARDYALSRKAFGQPIGAFQSVKHRIAELYVLVEIARANCQRAMQCQEEDDFTAAAAARLSAGEAYETAARDCIQIHGGMGVTWDLGLHLHQRRARSLAIELGNAFFWEDLLAQQLTGFAA